MQRVLGRHCYFSPSLGFLFLGTGRFALSHALEIRSGHVTQSTKYEHK